MDDTELVSFPQFFEKEVEVGTITTGMLFKRTVMKCDDPFGNDCVYERDFCFNEKNTLAYALTEGWHKDTSSGKLACPNCWGKKQGNYKKPGTIENINYDLVFENHSPVKINLKVRRISLENLNEILRREIDPKDMKYVQIKSSSWASHWYYDGGIHGSSLRIIIQREKT